MKTLVWAGGDDAIYRISMRNGITSGTPVSYLMKNNLPQRYMVVSVNDTVFIFSVSTINYYDRGQDSFKEYKNRFTGTGSRLKFIFSQPDLPWVKTDDEWINISSAGNIENNDRALLKIFDNLSSICTDKNNIWVIGGDNMLFRIVRNKLASINPEVGLFIRSISDSQGINFKLSDIVFSSGENNVYFDIVAPGYLKEKSTQYQWILGKGEWSKWSYTNTINLMIKPGKYELQVRAKDIWGNISVPKIVRFTIEAPFTQTSIFYALVLVVTLILLTGVVRFRERQLKKEKSILETKVKERTAQIEAQKHEITSSIEYASRIQMAMLPEDYHFRKSFSDYFIIFKPREYCKR